MSKPEPLIIGKNTKKVGKGPSIALINPKYPRNVAAIIRLASCWNFPQVWFTGNRVTLDEAERLPREERMKGYQNVELIQNDYFFDQFDKSVTPVAVEVRENSENLFEFQHPENALYVFGPEDGSIPRVTLQHCHRFVVIPSKHCLNLATAVSTVLYDRAYKSFLNGNTESAYVSPGEVEGRGGGLPSAEEDGIG